MRITALLCMFLAAAGQQAQADGRPAVSLGLDYSSGTYGGATTTETWALPLSLKYQTDAWRLRLSTAWLRVRGKGDVTPEGEPLNAPGNRSVTEGMGDLTAAATYNLVDERTHWAGLDIGGKIKFGTASASKSLGTGRNDYTVQAELFKPIGKWMPFLNLGYKWKGDPDSIDYRNVWLGSAGTDYRISRTLSLGGSYDAQQALTSTSDPVREAVLYLNFRLGAASRLNLYAVGGFSHASPDWGSGLIYSQRF
jgi:hypothetical protein